MIAKLIFILIISLGIFVRYKNTCECNNDKEIKFDILQLILIGIFSFLFVNINELLKFASLIFLSFIIKEIVKKIFSPKIKYGKQECDCKNFFKL